MEVRGGGSPRGARRRLALAGLLLGLVVVFATSVVLLQRITAVDIHHVLDATVCRPQAQQQAQKHDADRSDQWSPPATFAEQPQQNSNTPPPFAFATFLSAWNQTGDEPEKQDFYFENVRMLNYALRHAPTMRSWPLLPFIVLVEANVTQAKREILRREGATVVEGEHLTPEWILSVLTVPRWSSVMMKLNLGRMTEYEKICFLDADTLVNARMDGIFYDPATNTRRSGTNVSEMHDDEAPLPKEYMYAAMLDKGYWGHPVPPREEDWYYINAGFYCIKPSQELFDYYMSFLATPFKFMPIFPEQGLYNLAHRPEGNLPYARLDWRWNTNFPTQRDLEFGTKSFHGKLWVMNNTKMLEHNAVVLHRMWWYSFFEMERYFKTLHGDT